MLQTGPSSIREFISDRLFKIHEELLRHDQQYQELEQKSTALNDQLSARLALEEQKLLYLYDDTRREQMNRENDLVYGQALADGILLVTLVERVQQGKREEPGE